MKKVARLRNPEEIAINNERMAVRTTGRIKKAKVVFDPSDNYLPKHQRTSAGSVNSNQLLDNVSDSSNERRQKDEKPRNYSVDPFDGSVCYICGRKESKKVREIISCKDCDHKAHISCLQLEFEDLNKLRENYRCDVCQICSSCYEGPEDGDLITCTKCVKSFHYSCHIPSMARFAAQSKWFCSKCTIPKPKSLLKVVDNKVPLPLSNTEIDKNTDAKEVTKIIELNHAAETKPNPVLPMENGNKLFNITPSELGEIANVKNWSTGEVKEYFGKFFPKEAYIFQDHDIDGQSLLLLKRSDVINNLSIRLGPALRIYNLILKIQSQSTDQTLGW